MPKSLSTPADAADPADAAIVAEALPQRSLRVRELPPPPRAGEELLGLPEIRPGRSKAPWWQRWLPRRVSAAFTVSFLFHFFLLVGLALLVERSLSGTPSGSLIAYLAEPLPLESGLADETSDALVFAPGRDGSEAVELRQQALAPPIVKPSLTATNVEPSADSPLWTDPARQTDWLLQADADVSGALRGRGREARAALAGRDGGNQHSERAVERGLRWLLAVQRADGSWNFDHTNTGSGALCRNPGNNASTTGATAVVLMAFLGAGYTHTEGAYQDAVERGLYYLRGRAVSTPQGYNLQEGTMYAQALAGIALCEAYAMTADPELKNLAQGTINYIVYAQDRSGGGWRYAPGEKGDTTVTGWQLMALKSGQMAGLDVPRSRIYLVQRFLTGVQTYGGAQYGYLEPGMGRATTAVGLLCRMYTGWRRDHPALKQGVRFLAEWGPDDDGVYYNYYATQVMHHWEGPQWKAWNQPMRDHLVRSQATAGAENGSWFFPGDAGAAEGGRLYCTAMAVMTLEVYYRHMPLYGRQSVEDEF